MDITSAAESWKPVLGYEGFYEVSDQGRVRSLDQSVRVGHGAFRTRRGRMLKQRISSGRYPGVTLSRNSKIRPTHVHVLVLEAFTGPRPDGMHVCHINDICTDNRLVNLRWGTRFDNMQDCVRNGNHNHASKTHCKHGHEFTPENTYRTERGRWCRTCRRASRAARRVDRKTMKGVPDVGCPR